MSRFATATGLSSGEFARGDQHEQKMRPTEKRDRLFDNATVSL